MSKIVQSQLDRETGALDGGADVALEEQVPAQRPALGRSEDELVLVHRRAPIGTDRGEMRTEVFLLDTTGSMSDEIDRLKEHMTTVAKRIATRDADLHVRFGLTAYRDPGNAFLTRTFDLTGDVVAFNSALGEVQADGGGDTPEAPSAGLRAALDKPAWRGDDTVKLLFLVADAHRRCRTRKAPTTRWKRYAPRRGVNPIVSSGLDDQGEYVYRQLAQITTGRFVFLTYGRTATPATPPPTTWTSIP